MQPPTSRSWEGGARNDAQTPPQCTPRPQRGASAVQTGSSARAHQALPLRHRRGRPGVLAHRKFSRSAFSVWTEDRRLRAAGVLRSVGANRCQAGCRGPAHAAVERRWWAGTAPSPRACAVPSSSGTASTSTAKGGVTPTSRTGFENVSGPRASPCAPQACAPPRAPGRRALRPGSRLCPRASILEATWLHLAGGGMHADSGEG